jgi:hypothetical protein
VALFWGTKRAKKKSSTLTDDDDDGALNHAATGSRNTNNYSFM